MRVCSCWLSLESVTRQSKLNINTGSRLSRVPARSRGAGAGANTATVGSLSIAKIWISCKKKVSVVTDGQDRLMKIIAYDEASAIGTVVPVNLRTW